MDDEFADHGVVVWWDAVAGAGVGVDADAEPAWGAVGFDESGTWAEALGVVFRVDAALDGVALDMDVALFVGDLLARRDLDGHLDDVNACDGFGDGVLDLDSGVDLEHIEVLVVVHEELDGRGTGVVGGLDELGGGFADFLNFLAFDVRARCFFDDFLMSALHGAIAFPEVNRVAVLVADGLNLDMPGVFEEFFDEDAAVAECGECFLLCLGDIGAEGCFVVADAHAPSAAARRCLDDDRVADFSSNFNGFFEIVDLAFGAGEDGDLGGSCVAFGFDLVAEFGHGFRGWSDELDFTVPADFGEVGALGEEAVSGVDGVYIGDFCCGDNAGDIEVGVLRGAGADADFFVGLFEIGGVFVGG